MGSLSNPDERDKLLMAKKSVGKKILSDGWIDASLPPEFQIFTNMTKVIAEIGCNHMGSFETALEMISVAARVCKVDAVKFQKRHNQNFLVLSNLTSRTQCRATPLVPLTDCTARHWNSLSTNIGA